jgi:hypothetical protein
MKTNFEAVDVIWKRLNDNKPTISGGIYKLVRPFNSILEDITINSLPITDDVTGECLVNVNIHIPNIEVKVSGGANSSFPDLFRLKSLTETVIGLLNDVKVNDYYFFVSGQAILQNEARNEYYSNLRITFLFKN